MLSARARVEVIRFALLLTMTVGLIAVANRAGHSGSTGSRPDASSPAATTTSAPGATRTPPAAPGRSTSSPGARSPRPGSGSTGTGSAGPGSAGAGSAGAGSAGPTGSGSTGSAGATTPAAATLPRTGPGAVLRLTALALALIGGGMLSASAGRRARG